MKKLFLITSLVLTSTWVQAEPYNPPRELYFEPPGTPYRGSGTKDIATLPQANFQLIDKSYKQFRIAETGPLSDLAELVLGSRGTTLVLFALLNKGCAGGQDLFKSPVKTPNDVLALQKEADKKSETREIPLDEAIKIQVTAAKIEKSKIPCNSIFGKKEFTGPTRQHYAGEIKVTGAKAQ